MKSNCPLDKISKILLWIFAGLIAVFFALLLLLRFAPGLFESESTTPIYLQEKQSTGADTPIPQLTVAPTKAEEVDLPIPEEEHLSAEFDPVLLGRRMLELINEARLQQGLSSVEWDQTIADIGTLHAEEMAENEYISHWNLLGFGPDVRYNLSGKTEWVRENLHTSWERYETGEPVPVDDWNQLIEQGHIGLMNSPGHRENILEPGHTHVGIGFAYNVETGYFAIAQEFINRYVKIINDPPRELETDQDIIFQAELLGNASNPVVNIFYEPFPQPMSVGELRQTSTYISPSTFLNVIPIEMNDDGAFTFVVTINGDPGIYHIMIWVDTESGTSQSIDYQIWKK